MRGIAQRDGRPVVFAV